MVDRAEDVEWRPDPSREPIGLRVHPGGRFLVTREGEPFFLLGDAAWALPWKLGRSDVVDYLRHRRNQGFNAVGIIAYSAWHLEPNAYGNPPFRVVDGEWDPTSPITRPGGDPWSAAEYDYWDHLEYILERAAELGMVALVSPAFGDFIAGSWNGDDVSRIVLDPDRAYAYGRWIGDRFKDAARPVWMIGGDRSAVYGERDYRPAFRALAEGIADGTNGARRRDGRADYTTTLMSFWPRKKRPNSSAWFHRDGWLDFNSIQEWPEDQLAAIERDYALTPVRPTWLFEGRYERYRPEWTDYQVRLQAYQTVFAGGLGHVYGNEDIYRFGPSWRRERGDGEFWRSRLDTPGALDMGHLRDLMGALDAAQYLDRIPDPALISGDPGAVERLGSSRLVATRGAAGDYAMIYSANGRSMRIRMSRLRPPAVDAHWFNPRNGRWHVEGVESVERAPFARGIATGAGAPDREFDPPGTAGPGHDWVLVLTAARGAGV